MSKSSLPKSEFAPLPAANEAPGLPEGTTLWDLVVALQESADEICESEDEADLAVFAAMVEMRHQLVPAERNAKKKAA